MGLIRSNPGLLLLTIMLSVLLHQPARAETGESGLPETIAVPNEADAARLQSGQVLTRNFEHADGLRGSVLRFWAKASPDQCFAILADPAKLAEFMPSVHSVRVLGEQPDGTVLRMVSQVPFAPDLTIRRWGVPATRTIRWVQVRTPFRRLEGRWQMHPLGEGTCLEYALGVDTTGNLIPGWVISGLQQQGTRDIARNVRRRIESGGTWKKPG